MQWQHDRRLIFLAGPEWLGFFCQRCCRSRRLPANPAERDALGKNVQTEFDGHDCKQFALEN
jgi:hypothetical protein